MKEWCDMYKKRHITLSCLRGNCDEFPLKQKTLREDATRCMWNMSAKADCIWRAKRNKSFKD